MRDYERERYFFAFVDEKAALGLAGKRTDRVYHLSVEGVGVLCCCVLYCYVGADGQTGEILGFDLMASWHEIQVSTPLNFPRLKQQ